MGREDRVDDDDFIFHDRRNPLTLWPLAHRRSRRGSLCRGRSRDVLLGSRIVARRRAPMADLRGGFRFQPLTDAAKVRFKPGVRTRGKRKTNTESRPRGNRLNLPKPKPPSLGCPRSFTPQPLTASIQLRTRDSSLLATKSKKGRPMISVVVKKVSLEQ